MSQPNKNLAVFDDKNQNVVTSLAKTERQKLQYDYDLAYEVYKSLAQQLEEGKIKVKEETPVFTIIEPIVIPIQKSEPITDFYYYHIYAYWLPRYSVLYFW